MIRGRDSNRASRRSRSPCSPTGIAAAEGAPDPSRSEYVARLEGICKPRALATKRAVRGMRADLRAERLAVAASKFSQGLSPFRGHRARDLAATPSPGRSRDARGNGSNTCTRRNRTCAGSSPCLRADRPVAFQHASARFVKSGERADDVVLAFGFDFCYFKLSRFE